MCAALPSSFARSAAAEIAIASRRAGSLLLVAGSIAYPLLVFLLHGHVSALGFVVFAVALVVLRLVTLDAAQSRLWRAPMALALAALALLAFADARAAARAYPTLLSAAACLAFVWTLRHPPSLVERLARRIEPGLPQAATAYCRWVTVLWAAWLAINAVVAAALALLASLELWLVWTGIVAYAVSGVLLLGERLVRPLLRRRAVPR
jgi:uncharacterized membrane protein